MTITGTLQLACPTCGMPKRPTEYSQNIPMRARQAELATERAGERPLTSVEVWATMRVTVDVEAVKREIGEPDPWPGDPEPQERTDQEIAEDYVNGEAGATIDNHITIQEIATRRGPRQP